MLRYREYIVRNALYSLRHRYAGSSMGFTWHVLYPLAQIILYSAVFSGIMRARLGMLPDLPMAFTVYLCIGLIPWHGFADIVTRGSDALINNANIVLRTPLPEPVFFALDAVAGLLTMSIGTLLVLVFALACGVPPAWSWLALPLVLVAFCVVGFGLGMGLGVLNVFTRDVAPLVAIGLQLAFWTVPIVYVEAILPEPMREMLVYNPLFPFVSALHGLVLEGRLPAPRDWLAMYLTAATATGLGWLLLHRLRAELRDAL